LRAARPRTVSRGVWRARRRRNERPVGHRTDRAVVNRLQLDARRRPVAVVDDPAVVDPLVELRVGDGRRRTQGAGHGQQDGQLHGPGTMRRASRRVNSCRRARDR
jgi:hypothetical protein